MGDYHRLCACSYVVVYNPHRWCTYGVVHDTLGGSGEGWCIRVCVCVCASLRCTLGNGWSAYSRRRTLNTHDVQCGHCVRHAYDVVLRTHTSYVHIHRVLDIYRTAGGICEIHTTGQYFAWFHLISYVNTSRLSLSLHLALALSLALTLSLDHRLSRYLPPLSLSLSLSH